MKLPISKEALDKLKQFIDICKSNPDVVHCPELSFFKEYIELLGGKIPEESKMSSEPKVEPKEPEPPSKEPIESDPESELEFDITGCLEPDKLDENQKMGDPSKIEISEEDSNKANDKRIKAQQFLSEGNTEQAVHLFNEAIELNPQSALLFAKRGQAYLKLGKPNACIKDCTRALEINCDSAAAYKFRGRAYRLLGEWELAAKDLRQACNIDFDEQTDEWLKEVTPNAKKIEEHNLKKERKQKEKEEKEKLEKIRKAREAHARAAQDKTKEVPEMDTSATGFPGMGDFSKLLQDPELLAAFQDPEVSTALQDILANPANFIKYQSNPKVMALIAKLSSKVSGSGPNFPGFPSASGGFSGVPDAAAHPPTQNEDNLD